MSERIPPVVDCNEELPQEIDYRPYTADLVGEFLLKVAPPVMVGVGVAINVANSFTEQSPPVYAAGYIAAIVGGLAAGLGYGIERG